MLQSSSCLEEPHSDYSRCYCRLHISNPAPSPPPHQTSLNFYATLDSAFTDMQSLRVSAVKQVAVCPSAVCSRPVKTLHLRVLRCRSWGFEFGIWESQPSLIPRLCTQLLAVEVATAASAAVAHGKLRKAAEDSCDPMRPLLALRPFAGFIQSRLSSS